MNKIVKYEAMFDVDRHSGDGEVFDKGEFIYAQEGVKIDTSVFKPVEYVPAVPEGGRDYTQWTPEETIDKDYGKRPRLNSSNELSIMAETLAPNTIYEKPIPNINKRNPALDAMFPTMTEEPEETGGMFPTMPEVEEVSPDDEEPDWSSFDL